MSRKSKKKVGDGGKHLEELGEAVARHLNAGLGKFPRPSDGFPFQREARNMFEEIRVHLIFSGGRRPRTRRRR